MKRTVFLLLCITLSIPLSAFDYSGSAVAAHYRTDPGPRGSGAASVLSVPWQSDAFGNSNALQGGEPAPKAWEKAVDMTHIGLPLFAGGLLMKGPDVYYRSMRNDYFPEFSSGFDDGLQYLPAVVMVGMKAFGVPSRSSWGGMAVSGGLAVVIEAGLVNAIKYTAKVPRPDGSTDNSFPSGHTTTAFMAASLLTKEYGHLSPWIGIGAYTVATATGLMRVANNRHWLSDVLAGAGIGILSTELAYWISDMILKEKGRSDAYSPVFYDEFDRSDRPSFVGLKFGANLSPGRYAITEGLSLERRGGASIGIEGAWFFSPYIGVGGEALLSDSSLMADGVEICTANSEMLLGGGYFSYPLSGRWLAGTKALCGVAHYQELSFAESVLPSRCAFCLGSGLSLSYRATEHYSMRLFADWKLSAPHNATAGRWMNTLSAGLTVAIN